MLLIVLSLFFVTNSNAACDDPLTDGVDYSNCRFSDAQDLQGSYLPNSNLSFASFIQVNFDKSIMMNSNLSLNIANANFEGANLIGATWTNGETCGPNSIGVCNK